ncbi:hypothetical protein V8C40DRAFT_258613 [Trichoderma camerunense]
MSQNVTIRERAATCVDLFSQAILLLAQTESSDDQNGLLDEFGRFKLWTSNIGVFADLHSSLDYRLRDFNDIKDSFTRQLITIESRLQQLHDAAKQDLSKTSIKEDEDEEPGISASTKSTTAATFQDWNTTQLLQSIHQSIDWLHRLSNLVRKASFANQHKRADKFILKDDDDNDMSDTLTDYYTKLIKREFNGMQDTLVQRLAASMLVRRRRIMYRRSQQHRWKMPQVEPKTKSLELASTKLMPTPLEPSVPFQNEKVVVLEPEAITTAPSRLTATTVDKNIRQRVLAPSGISKGSTAPLNEQSMLLVPPSPKGANLGEDFVCDYCCLILPSKIALNRKAWADHVNKDLYPYVCVVDKCDDPIEIYSSRKEWLTHMSTRHLMRWYCIAKPHTQALEFDSENGFIEHMKIEHPGKFRNDQLSLVAENSSRPKDTVFDDCPFCIGTSDNLEDHVGLHLRDLALRSLPWPDDDERYSQQGDYLHSDNSISNENIPGTAPGSRSQAQKKYSYIDGEWVQLTAAGVPRKKPGKKPGLRGTILDFVSESESDSTENADSDGGSEHNTRRLLGSRSHIGGTVMQCDPPGLQGPCSYFCDAAGRDDPPSLREQLSDKTLIRLAIKQYQGDTELSTLSDKLEALLSDEYSKAEDAAHLEEAIVIIQQLTDENSPDQDDSDGQSDKPLTIQDEILRISVLTPNVRWDNIDMDNLTLSASLKGPWGKDGIGIFMKIKIDIPTEYPELKAPKFIIEKSPSIPEETHKRLDQELHELAEQFTQKKQNCLETIFTYLVGEIDFESATPFTKNNSDFSDDRSTEGEDEIPVGGSAIISQELPPADADRAETVPSVSIQTARARFDVAIFCVLLIEYDAACLILDRIWDKDYERNEQDENIYTTGCLGRHNIVIALLPHTRSLADAVTTTTAQFQFTNSESALLLRVGICGGAPKFNRSGKEVEILLGDVVINRFDSGRTYRFRRTNALENRAKQVLYSFSQLDASEDNLWAEMHRILFELQTKEVAIGKMLKETKFKYSVTGLKDRLFEAHYIHKHHFTADDCSVCNGGPDAVCSYARKASCQEIGCDERQLVLRKTFREETVWGPQMPIIHFGKIASGEIVVKNGLERDKASDQAGVIAFDKDRLGGWGNFPYISIKGVCDYADGHRDDSWQNYAAITAAATTKAFLVRIDD